MPDFRTIVADPPWRYTKNPPPANTAAGVSAEHKYDTLSTDELAHIDVGRMAAADAHLYVWVTNPVLTHQRPGITGRLSAMDLIRAWGFEPKTLLTWVKGRELQGSGAGMGFYFRGDTEHVIFAVRGRLPIPPARRITNVFCAPKARHSAKPDAFMKRVEMVSPGPYLELFARQARPGWERWGNETDSTVEVAAHA